MPWAELAEQCGFYDQSHLINEFRRFTGFSPVELARRDRPDSGSVVVGRVRKAGKLAQAKLIVDASERVFPALLTRHLLPFFPRRTGAPGAESRHNNKGGAHA